MRKAIVQYSREKIKENPMENNENRDEAFENAQYGNFEEDIQSPSAIMSQKDKKHQAEQAAHRMAHNAGKLLGYGAFLVVLLAILFAFWTVNEQSKLAQERETLPNELIR